MLLPSAITDAVRPTPSPVPLSASAKSIHSPYHPSRLAARVQERPASAHSTLDHRPIMTSDSPSRTNGAFPVVPRTTRSPPPLQWDQGWNADHFAFDEVTKSNSGRSVHDRRWDATHEQPEGVVYARLGVGRDDRGELAAAGQQKSSLIPTATSFVSSTHSALPAPAAASAQDATVFSSTAPAFNLRPLSTRNQDLSSDSFHRSRLAAPIPAATIDVRPRTRSDLIKPSHLPWNDDVGGVDVASPLGNTAPWSFDSQGLLSSNEASYHIADEILQLQSQPFSPGLPSPRSGLDSTTDRPLFSPHDESPRWRQGAHSPTARFAGGGGGGAGRERAGSLASVYPNAAAYPGSYFPTPSPALDSRYDPRPTPLDRAAAAAQLSSYFGPSAVPVSPQAYDFAPEAVYGTLPSPSLDLTQLAYQTDPDDLLYTQARQTFVHQSLLARAATGSGLSDPRADDARTAAMSHFDIAMHSINPLATLYGLSDEAARALAADPEASGISDSVIRLASMRSQAQRSSMGVAGLAGPSANNRKLGLYKVRFCHSRSRVSSCPAS